MCFFFPLLLSCTCYSRSCLGNSAVALLFITLFELHCRFTFFLASVTDVLVKICENNCFSSFHAEAKCSSGGRSALDTESQEYAVARRICVSYHIAIPRLFYHLPTTTELVASFRLWLQGTWCSSQHEPLLRQCGQRGARWLGPYMASTWVVASCRIAIDQDDIILYEYIDDFSMS